LITNTFANEEGDSFIRIEVITTYYNIIDRTT